MNLATLGEWFPKKGAPHSEDHKPGTVMQGNWFQALCLSFSPFHPHNTLSWQAQGLWYRICGDRPKIWLSLSLHPCCEVEWQAKVEQKGKDKMSQCWCFTRESKSHWLKQDSHRAPWQRGKRRCPCLGVGRIKGFENRPWWHLVCRKLLEERLRQGEQWGLPGSAAAWSDKETLPGGKVSNWGRERKLGLVLQEGVATRRMIISMDPYISADLTFNWQGKYLERIREWSYA